MEGRHSCFVGKDGASMLFFFLAGKVRMALRRLLQVFSRHLDHL